MIKKVNILSQDSISETMRMFDELADYLSSPELIRVITDEAYNMVKYNVSVYAPNRVSSIFEEVNGNTGTVYTNDKVLVYNEYGTGLVGSENPHPDLQGWEYMKSDKINYESGWHYLNDETGEAGFTKGLPARMGFYNAREKLKSIVGDKLQVAMENNFKRYTK